MMSPQDAASLRARVQQTEFVDGTRSARGAAKERKQNAQSTPRTDPRVGPLVDEVVGRLADHPTFADLAFPRSFVGVRFSRYGIGDHYGFHVDRALMGRPPDVHRTDLSFTLFLSDIDAYEGGALRLGSRDGGEPIRLPAGSMALYPTHLLHEVTPVTRGERLACVGWIESWIPDASLREIIAKLGVVRRTLTDEGVAPLPRMMFDEAWQALVRYGAR